MSRKKKKTPPLARRFRAMVRRNRRKAPPLARQLRAMVRRKKALRLVFERRCRLLAQAIADFNEYCEASEHTDTGDAWRMLEDARGLLEEIGWSS